MQAAYPPHDVLCVLRMEVRCPYPRLEAVGVEMQVSSPYYGHPWYVTSRQTHEDLCVALFADHIRAQTASFDSNLANSADTYGDRGLTPSPDAKAKGSRGQQASA